MKAKISVKTVCLLVWLLCSHVLFPMDSYTHRTYSVDKHLTPEQTSFINSLTAQLSKGDMIESATPFGPAINLATRFGKIELVKKLLGQKAEPSISTMVEAIAFNRTDIIELILEVSPVLLHARDEMGTLLHIACLFNNKEMVEYFIKKGLDINSLNNRRQTPLYVAASRGRKDIVQILCAHGANPFVTDEQNIDPLHKASARFNNPFKEVKYLFDRSTNMCDYDGIVKILCRHINNFNVQ